MNTSKRQIARNAAKVEFIANAEEAVEMLEKGFNKFNVYTILREKGRLTMSYRSFCRNLQQIENPEKKKKDNSKGTVKQIVSPSLRVPAKKEPFGQLEDVDVSKLI